MCNARRIIPAPSKVAKLMCVRCLCACVYICALRCVTSTYMFQVPVRMYAYVCDDGPVALDASSLSPSTGGARACACACVCAAVLALCCMPARATEDVKSQTISLYVCNESGVHTTSDKPLWNRQWYIVERAATGRAFWIFFFLFC